MSGWNDRVVDEFRANGGRVQGFGTGLVLLHTVGARSGEPRINPVAATIEGGSWVVCASLRGAPTNPAWYYNLLAHPDVVIETPQGSVDVHAIDVEDEDEYRATFERFAARYPTFREYAESAAPRRMPLLRLEPRG